MGNHYNRLLRIHNDIIPEEIGLHSELGQDTFQQASLFPAAQKLQQTTEASHSHKQNRPETFQPIWVQPQPSSGNWCSDSYPLFYWLCWNKTQMRQSINVSVNCGTMCFSQSLYWPGLAEPPMSTRTGQCRSSWRRSSPTLMATCWSWPHSWSQGCQENRQQRNTSAYRFILCRYQSGFQKIWSIMLWETETETLTETEILIWNIQVEIAYIIMILKSTCVKGATTLNLEE